MTTFSRNLVYFVTFITGPAVCYGQIDNARIQQGVNLVKFACGTGVSSEKFEVKGGASGSITLKHLPGAQAQGDITYSKEEAQGLVAALNKEVSSGSIHLSEKQIDCMKPYIDRLFDLLFPPSEKKVSVVIRSDGPYIEEVNHHDSIDNSLSSISLSIDGYLVTYVHLDEPFGNYTIQLNLGEHVFEFEGDVWLFGGTHLDDKCDGVVSVDRSLVLKPSLRLRRVNLGVSFAGCDLLRAT